MPSPRTARRGLPIAMCVIVAALCAQVGLALNIAISKTASNPTPVPGEQIDYTITASNSGPEQATSIIISDLLPPGLEYITNNLTSGVYVPSSGDWTIGNPVPANSSVSLTLTAEVGLPYKLAGTIEDPSGTSFDYFGYDVDSVGHNMIISGCHQNNINDPLSINNAGIAHLCLLDGTLVLSVTNPAPVANDFFGYSVAGIGNSLFAVSAYRQQTGSFLESGNVYIYNTAGMLVTTINNPTPGTEDYFGYSLASVNDRYLLIGAHQDDLGVSEAGTAYLYDTNGSQLCIFTSPTPRTGDQFGFDVAGLGPDMVVIGAPGDNPGSLNNAGSVHVFTTNGTLVRTISNPGPTIDDYFGSAVDGVGTDRVLIGMYGEDVLPETDSGSAYLYNIDGTQLQSIQNPEPYASDTFGSSVACVGRGLLLVGAQLDNTRGSTDLGSAYLYSTNGSLLVTLTNAMPTSSERYGLGLASISPDSFAVSAYRNGAAGTRSGTIYVYSLANAPSPQNIASLSSVTPADTQSGDDSAIGVITVTNRAPVASDDLIVIPEDTPLTMMVLTNDFDNDSFDTLWVTNITGSVSGIVNIAWSGYGIEFTPELNWFGTNVINYSVADNRGLYDTATVTIVVTPVNDLPVITNQPGIMATTNQIFEVRFEHLLVFDPDNVYTDDFTLAVSDGANYTLTNNTIYHSAAFTGMLDVPVTVNDGQDDSMVYMLQVAAAHWLSVTNAANGTVPSLDGWYPHGSNVSISATGSAGFCFLEWTGDIDPQDSRSNPAIVEMDHPRTLTATFTGDSDIDLIPDTWENANIGNLSEDESGNTDGDVYTLAQEYRMGLDPTKLDIGLPLDAVEISWTSEAGSNYQIRATADLINTQWVDIGSSIAGTGSEISGYDIAADRDLRIFNVVGSAVTIMMWDADGVYYQAGSGTNYQLQWADTWFLGAWTNTGSQISGSGSTNAAFMQNRGKIERYYRLDTP